MKPQFYKYFRIIRDGHRYKLQRYAAPWNVWTWIDVKMSDMNPHCSDDYESPKYAIDHVSQNITDNAEYLMA